MTVLQSLASYYERMAARGEAEPPGFSREKISFAVVIDSTGEPVAVMDLRDSSGKRPVPALRDVPASFKRPGTGVHPFFLWDSSAYVFGVSSDETKRTAAKHQAFRELHSALLASATDVGLCALRRFLEKWTTERFSSAPFTPDMRDTNIVFRLDGDVDERGRPRFVHERPAAQPLIEERSSEGETGFCLITGAEGCITRLHPAIKGVHANSPPPGGSHSLVSFNLPAFESWGKTQGANAPTGQAAAFRYGAALNRLLERGSRNRMRIGDATVTFWADASAAEEDSATDTFLASLLGEIEKREDYDAQQAAKLREVLELLAKGQPARIGTDGLYPETRIHILGLSPNGPRLSVRFWLTENLGELASNLTAHERDCRVEPLPRKWGAGPSINRLLVKTVAAQEERDNIPPLLAGEMARAVLGGSSYPRTLLSNAIMRLRAGDDPGAGWHAAGIRAVLMRSQGGGGAPVSLDKQETNAAYRLGRLFAVLEEAQERALGRGVNATIRDRYFGAASATPARVFPLLLRGVQNHLGKLRKEEPRAATVIEIRLGEVMEGLASELPRSLRLEDQGRFAIGYYHQRSARFAKKGGAPDEQGD
jgi:CRISPR-associated protein Csd1